ncbi:competence type IV pilus minor pilin ComGF [Streptococcus ovis]|uniref:competence type IV pilus minor pilin ComGF n=1 Tax=Streptococcus ovis TaxID=82806 RepID=UPI00037E3678|nr:competence type IV pilus minor pilin ComGF [Streptococcus ovis]
MWKKSKAMAAFTLLECLVALVVLSGGLLVFDGLSRLLSQEIHYQTHHSEQGWLLFSEQLRIELEGVRLVKVEDNHLYVDKDGQTLAFGQSKSDDFRKTNGRGRGYQPMLYGVTSSKISQSGNRITISLVFENGLERIFLYDFSEKS